MSLFQSLLNNPGFFIKIGEPHLPISNPFTPILLSNKLTAGFLAPLVFPHIQSSSWLTHSFRILQPCSASVMGQRLNIVWSSRLFPTPPPRVCALPHPTLLGGEDGRIRAEDSESLDLEQKASKYFCVHQLCLQTLLYSTLSKTARFCGHGIFP